jgi:acetoin utilization protein AcuB
MLVSAVMSQPVVTLEARKQVRSAAELMRTRRFRHLPIVEKGRLAGIISDREVSPDDRRSLAEVMHRRVITASPGMPVEEAAALMLENKIGCLPVVDAAGALVGIVTESDLFALLARMLGGTTPSTRLELQLDDLPAQLEAVAAVAHRYRVPVTSLVVEPSERPDEGSRRAVLRVGTIDASRFVAALRTMGVPVDAPETTAGERTAARRPPTAGDATRGRGDAATRRAEGSADAADQRASAARQGGVEHDA